jgi:hypothetical protein
MPPTTNPTNSTAATPPTRLNQKTTADKPLLSTSKTINEHILGEGMKTDVTNTPAARKLLMTHGLILLSAGNMLEAILVALFEFSIMANLGAMHTDIIRALALMIHDVNSDLDTENVISTIKTFLGGPIATLDKKVDQFEDTVKAHKETTEKTIEEVCNKLDESTEKLGKMVEKVEALTANCMQTANGVKGSDGPKTYASAAKTNIPTALSKIIAKNEAQARQILIDRRSPIHVNSLRELTEAQLVAKATMAVELMAKMVESTCTLYGHSKNEFRASEVLQLNARRTRNQF